SSPGSAKRGFIISVITPKRPLEIGHDVDWDSVSLRESPTRTLWSGCRDLNSGPLDPQSENDRLGWSLLLTSDWSQSCDRCPPHRDHQTGSGWRQQCDPTHATAVSISRLDQVATDGGLLHLEKTRPGHFGRSECGCRW